MTCPISAASAERSFSKLKLNKTFHRSTTMDDRLTSLALISIESACVRSLDYNIIDVFATAKARKTIFEYWYRSCGACVCLFFECVIKMGQVCLDWFKQCKLFN